MKDNNFLPRFLFSPNYRVWRHLIFILVGAIITFNQVFIAYQDSQAVLGNRIYLICATSFMVYLIALYFNYFYLTPKYLLKGNYIGYAVFLTIIVFSLPTLSIAGEYWVRNSLGLPHRITSYTHPLILVDNLSTTVITAVCFCGVSVIMFFGKWMRGNEEVSRMESEHVKSELNKLKGQIAPAFLSKTLRNASSLVESNPQQASDTLMRLGQLLRYLLYDCNRDRVLLKSEINSLDKFFELEQSNNPDMRYRIHIEGDIRNNFVAPMLFLSLVQCVIADSHSVELLFRLQDKTLSFTCKSDNDKPLDKDALSLIRQRLELQYPGKYAWDVSMETIELKIDTSE